MPGFPSIALIATLALGAGTAALAQTVKPDDWPTEKCNRYRKAFSDAVSRQGRQGLGPDFLGRNDAFLAANCQSQADVCPRSPEELKLANTLVILSMNAGMASTFAPFACRK